MHKINKLCFLCNFQQKFPEEFSKSAEISAHRVSYENVANNLLHTKIVETFGDFGQKFPPKVAK